ncbi:hypothetical protein [Synechococcus sp. M16CYN]
MCHQLKFDRDLPFSVPVTSIMLLRVEFQVYGRYSRLIFRNT